MEEVLEASAEQVVATLCGVHPESVQFFTPTAQKLIEEQGTSALAAYITFKGSNRSPLATGVQQNGITLFSCTPSTTRAMYEGLRIIGKLIMDNLNETGKINKPFNMLRTDSISVQDQDINKNLLIQI